MTEIGESLVDESGPVPMGRSTAEWESLLAGSERMVELSHGTTRYFTVGEGLPLILLHGVGYSYGGNSWLLNLEALGRGRQVIAPDMLGWGPGDRLEQEFSFAYLVDFVRELQDALGFANADVLGHSMGGWIASLLAYESPQRVHRLILADSGGLLQRQLASMKNFEPPTTAEVRAELLARFGDGISSTFLDTVAAIESRNSAREDALISYRRIMAHMLDPETRQRYNTRRRLPFVESPTLVIWGRNDTVNTLEMGYSTRDLIPDARMVVLECGHFCQSERPDEFNRAVDEFLRD